MISENIIFKFRGFHKQLLMTHYKNKEVLKKGLTTHDFFPVPKINACHGKKGLQKILLRPKVYVNFIF